VQKFYRRNGHFLVRRPPQRPRPNHVTSGDARNLWWHVMSLREAAGDHEGAARARIAATASVQLHGRVIPSTAYCAECSHLFTIRSPGQRFCSKRCRVRHDSPVHWQHPGSVGIVAACGNAARYARIDLDTEHVECGNCRRHSLFALADFAMAWKADKLHAR
jgi:hypothetical protein